MNFVIEIQSEFDYIVRSFQFVASMFSPGSSYIGLIATLGVLGIFFGGVSAISAQATSGKNAIISWFMHMLLASILIVAVINQKSNVTIHDTTTNQMRVVGGVPTVMATLAFIENRTEVAIKDIIATVMQPILSYEDIGSGKGFELLASLDEMGKNYLNRYPHIQRSVGDYFDKCALIDLERGWIDQDAVYHSSDVWKDLKSSTRTRYSVVYKPTDPQGTVYTCAEAWTKIDDMLTAPTIKVTVANECERQYSDPAAVNSCLANLDNIVQNFIGGSTYSVDLNSFLRSYIASAAIQSTSGSERGMMIDLNKKNTASAIMAEKTLPRLKGMLYGIIIGLFPLLVGFIWFNPAKTAIFYAGFFLLLLLWGVIDTFLDMQAQNEAYNVFREIRGTGLGLNTMLDFPGKAIEAVPHTVIIAGLV